jgi:hypothetical protein
LPGCPKCKKKFGTLPQFLDHLTDDVLPKLLDSVVKEWKKEATRRPPHLRGLMI